MVINGRNSQPAPPGAPESLTGLWTVDRELMPLRTGWRWEHPCKCGGSFFSLSQDPRGPQVVVTPLLLLPQAFQPLPPQVALLLLPQALQPLLPRVALLLLPQALHAPRTSWQQ